jgi:hypothetical protein
MNYIDYEYKGWVLRYYITVPPYNTHVHKKCGNSGCAVETGTWKWYCLTCHETMSKEVSLHLEQVYNLLNKT